MRSYEKRCGRCHGDGIYSETHGGCFNCGGNARVPGSGRVTVYVYTAAEKEASKLRAERTTRAHQIVREAAKAMRDAGKMDSEAGWYAEQGVRELRDREPERFAKMLESLEAGRIEDTVIALSQFCSEGYPVWYGKQEESSK